MVATLILHAKSDLDWATALAAELAEHAPVRLQLAKSPPKATIGPSVVRVALWSENAARDGVAASLAGILTGEPAHSILVRRDGAPPPAGVAADTLAGHIEATTARDAVAELKSAIPKVGGQVEAIVRAERVRVESERERRLRLADTALLIVVIAGLGAWALWADWQGVRTALMKFAGIS